MAYFRGSPSTPGPTPDTVRLPVRNRRHWRIIISRVLADNISLTHELYLDHANQVWAQNIVKKKTLLNPTDYQIEPFLYPGTKVHPLTKQKLE